MTSSSKPEASPQQPSPATPEVLARWLLAAQAGAQPSPAALAAAGEQAYLRLRARLAVLLGTSGFDALWARALQLAQPEFRSAGDTALADAPTTHAYGLHAVVRGHDLAGIEQNLNVAFASFIRLLCTFIGAELGVRFIRQLWPDLPLDVAGLLTEEAHHDNPS